MSRNSGVVHDIPSYVHGTFPSEWDELTNTICLFIWSAGYKGLNKHTNTRQAQSVRGNAHDWPSSHSCTGFTIYSWPNASKRLQETDLPVLTAVRCRSEAAPHTSVNCHTVLNSQPGFHVNTESTGYSHRGGNTQRQKQRHCVTLQRCIIQMATMRTSRPTRLPFQEPSVLAEK